jgi:hypothetical protein
VSVQSSESDGESVNEELRSYDGFSAVLSLLYRTAPTGGAPMQQPVVQDVPQAVAELRAALVPVTDDERAARQRLVATLTADPELADIVRRIRELNEIVRSRALAELGGVPDATPAEQA